MRRPLPPLTRSQRIPQPQMAKRNNKLNNNKQPLELKKVISRLRKRMKTPPAAVMRRQPIQTNSPRRTSSRLRT
jgi:hypothetical protein